MYDKLVDLLIFWDDYMFFIAFNMLIWFILLGFQMYKHAYILE